MLAVLDMGRRAIAESRPPGLHPRTRDSEPVVKHLDAKGAFGGGGKGKITMHDPTTRCLTGDLRALERSPRTTPGF